MIMFKYLIIIKKAWFITMYDWTAKIDYYDETGCWPGDEALEMIHAQSEDAWKRHTQRTRGQ